MEKEIKTETAEKEISTENISMANRYAFFQNRECDYFPCHKTMNPENFNCLFCYCPLYTLGDKCGGNFYYNEKGNKSCKNCLVPHGRKSIEYIMSKYPLLAEMARKK